MDRPNKDAYEKTMQEFNDQIESLKNERKKVQDKIDAAMTDPDSKSALSEARTKLGTLKSQKQKLIDEKKAMRNSLDATKKDTEKLIKDKKDVRSNVKFGSLEEINKEIAKLQRLQETTTMTLNEEKKLIKEMDALKASKSHIAELAKKDNSLDGIRETRKTIQESLKAKDKEIDGVSAQIDDIMKILKSQNEKDSKKRDAIQGLFKERDTFKKKMSAIIDSKDKVRDEYREANNKWFNYQRAVKAKKKIEWEAEKAAREAEHQEYLKKLEEEEAKKIPYEEEQELCEFLADFLERTYLEKSEKEASKEESDVVAVKDDPFAGMTPMKKNTEDFTAVTKSKKKRIRAAKPEAFSLSVDLIDQFGLLQLSPPTKKSDVEKSVEELRTKKAWYKEQPRGSVPTASEIRKTKKKVAPKKANPKSQNAGTFSINDDDFAPLGAGTSNTMNSTWGKSQS